MKEDYCLKDSNIILWAVFNNSIIILYVMSDIFSYRQLELRKSTSLRSLISETRCNQVYEHPLEERRSMLVISRYSLFEGGHEEHKQIDFFHKMVEACADSPYAVLRYGIDKGGYPFCFTEWFASKPLVSDLTNQNSVISNFIKCSTEVARYHAQGLYIGDLCLSSFRLLNDSEVILLPCLGAFEGSDKKTMNISIMSLLDYISPEQRINGESSEKSDIYSLGAVGYFLSVGDPSQSEKQKDEIPLLRRVPAPSQTNSALPEWYDQLIGNCLSTDPVKRISSAEEVLGLLKSGIQTGVFDLPAVKWQALDLIKVQNKSGSSRKKEDTADVSVRENKSSVTEAEKKKVKNSPSKRKKKQSSSRIIVLLIWLSTIVIGSGIALILFLTFKYIAVSPDELSAEVRLVYDEMNSSDQKSNLLYLFDESKDLNDRITALKSIIGKKLSWDAVLARFIASKRISSHISGSYLELFDSYSKELGYSEFVDAISGSLKRIQSTSSDDALMEVMSYLFTAIDPEAMPDSRQGAMRRLFALDKTVSFQLAALLAKDSSPHIFMPILRDFIITAYYRKLPKEVSRPVLFVLPPPVRELYGDIDISLDKLSDEELKEALFIILDNQVFENDTLSNAIISHYVERFELNPFEKYFLTMAKGSTLNNDTRQVFHKIAFGSASYEDMEVFVEWDDFRWEEVMYRLCVVSKDTEILNRAMDILQRRGARKKIALELITWLKKNFWGKRASYAYSVGILALKDESTEEEIEEAFLRLMPISQHGLFSALVQTGDPYYITQAAERLSAILTSTEVFPYLSHEIKEVRLASVRALIGKNDLVTLQRILRAYRKEKDPEVRELYNKYHWVTVDQEIPDSLKKNTLDE